MTCSRCPNPVGPWEAACHDCEVAFMSDPSQWPRIDLSQVDYLPLRRRHSPGHFAKLWRKEGGLVLQTTRDMIAITAEVAYQGGWRVDW